MSMKAHNGHSVITAIKEAYYTSSTQACRHHNYMFIPALSLQQTYQLILPFFPKERKEEQNNFRHPCPFIQLSSASPKKFLAGPVTESANPIYTPNFQSPLSSPCLHDSKENKRVGTNMRRLGRLSLKERGKQMICAR